MVAAATTRSRWLVRRRWWNPRLPPERFVSPRQAGGQDALKAKTAERRMDRSPGGETGEAPRTGAVLSVSCRRGDAGSERHDSGRVSACELSRSSQRSGRPGRSMRTSWRRASGGQSLPLLDVTVQISDNPRWSNVWRCTGTWSRRRGEPPELGTWACSPACGRILEGATGVGRACTAPCGGSATVAGLRGGLRASGHESRMRSTPLKRAVDLLLRWSCSRRVADRHATAVFEVGVGSGLATGVELTKRPLANWSARRS